MTKEQVIEVYKGVVNPKIREAFETLMPELRESEDERIRKALVDFFKKKVEKGFEWVEYGIPNNAVLAYLERQKEPKPAEWSEEDRERIQRIHDFMWKNRKGDTDTIYQIEKDADWLKSLLRRPIKVDNWKPSEEQMAVLLNAEGLVRANNFPENAKILASLYKNLKNLM